MCARVSGIILEINKAKCSKIKHHREHRIEEVWVFELIEQNIKQKRILILVKKYKKKIKTLTALLDNLLLQEA